MTHQPRTVRIPSAPVEYDPRIISELGRALQNFAATIPPSPAADGYDATNVTDTRTFDADATTLAEIADVLGTLIEDLKHAGYLG